MPAYISSATDIEDRIRIAVQERRVRVPEFFKDFDSLRSGCVTKDQFTRCLDLSFQIVLTPEEQQILFNKYEDKPGGRMVNYQKFADVIDCVFQPRSLNVDPASQKIEPEEFLGTKRSLRPLSPATQKRITDIVERIAPYYKYHGINIRTCYEDFDRHHIGVVTESQFHRSFPKPIGLDDDELDLLVQGYLDPERPGLCNYLNFHNDVEAIKRRIDEEEQIDVTPVSTYNIPQGITPDKELNEILGRIQVVCHKYGIRTTEFFCDHDKLRSGVITKNQFVCGLMLCIKERLNLTKGEVQKIVDYYVNPDGRLRYTDFCHTMENAFNDPYLEKNPRMEVPRPPRGALSRTLNSLTPAQERRVQDVLDTLAEDVRKRRIMTFPYFKDYDRSRAYTRNMTKTQFARVLRSLSLMVQPEDLILIQKKFEEPTSGDVNYPAFVQAIDKEFIGFTMDSDQPKAKPRPRTPTYDRPPDTSNVDVFEVISRIRHHVLVNRLRVCQFFNDFDPLKEYSIPTSKFRVGLSAMGLHDVNKAEFKVLSDYFSDPKKQFDAVLWKEFENEIETVFTQVQPSLEKTPMNKVPKSEEFLMKKPGTMDWRSATDYQKTVVDAAMDRMQQNVSQRRVLCKPCFQDFDLHNMGVVTKPQFRQCLAYLQLNASEPEYEALESKYSNHMGFDYLKFLEDLEPKPKQELKYIQRLEELKLVNEKQVSLEKEPLTDIEGIMTKIKNKVYKEGIRVQEFLKDYDKLRTGRMLKTTFERGLDLANLGLQPTEVAVLKYYCESPKDPQYVEYVNFCDEIESIFTLKNLEKAPRVTPKQYKPPQEVELNVLSPEAEAILGRVLQRLAEKVHKHSMQLFPLFEDYDRVHNGRVSRQQFRRVLTELELGGLVKDSEFHVLHMKFNVSVGGKKDVDYITFCDMINELASFDPRKP